MAIVPFALAAREPALWTLKRKCVITVLTRDVHRGAAPRISLPSQPRNNQPQPRLIPRRTSTMSAADAKVLKTEPLVRHCLPLPRPMPHHSLRGTQAAACPSLD